MNELMNRLNLMDCMEGMGHFPDKYFDLAIVDPPYGLGDRLVEGGGKKPMGKYKVSYDLKKWDTAPGNNFFNELCRVSKNQIIWGGNYFNLPPTRCLLVWDKKQMMPTFSRCEFAWTSFDKPAKIFEHTSGDPSRFHPTQKPVALYRWLLQNYAKPGYKILDTHVGSGSSLIACWEEGFEYCGFEIDEDYYIAACNRIEQVQAQGKLFATV